MGFPKDHKPVQEATGIPPLRPVVLCCGTALEGLGKIVDHFLRPVDEAALTATDKSFFLKIYKLSMKYIRIY